MSLTIAKIKDKDHDETVSCMFNPKEYTFSKQNSWTAKNRKGSDLARFEFANGLPTTLQMQLFFDTYSNIKSESLEGGTPKDVRTEYTEKIWKMMEVDTALPDLYGKSKHNKGRPPVVMFQWGATWTFSAVITSIKERFTLFLPTGTPVRSTLDVTFQQIKDKHEHPNTNPTSGGTGGERIWIVSGGDTLAWIAHKEYGDATLWRVIADANKLTQVRQLIPGTILEIPHA